MTPEKPPASPDAATMQIPDLSEPVQNTKTSASEAPTMHIPEVPQTRPVPQAAPVQQPKVQSAPTRPARETPQRPAPRIGLILGIISAALVLVMVLGVFIYGVTLKNGDTVYPNVYVAGINVGGMTRQEAITAVQSAVAESYASATLKVQLPDRTISFHPEQTNVALDADEAIDEALAYGRGGNPFAAVTSYFSCRTTEHYIDLQTILDLDTAYIRTLIEEVAAEIETAPEATKVTYNEEQGALEISVGYPERSLDVESLYEVVHTAFMNGDFSPLTWEYNEIPCEVVDLKPWYDQYATEMEDAYYDEETHSIVDEVPGFGFDLEMAAQRLSTAAAGSRLQIRFEEIEPEVTAEELKEEMFGEVLFTYSTEYVVNANRTNNLRLACEAINGTVLNPDEVFSFNNIVGERTAAKGYLPATVYSGGKSVEETGGGVCQVASTIYYCTLHLDLEQVHREPHQFVVTYVPYGMDATIYWGHIDYQFRNTLSNPLYMEANVDNGCVNITFRGIKETENTVEMSYVILETYPYQEVEEVDETKEPGYREVDVYPYTGYKVVTYKAILDENGKQLSREQEAVSVYDKRDKVTIVGPSEEQIPDEPLDPDNPFDPDDPFAPDDPWDPDEPLLPDDPSLYPPGFIIPGQDSSTGGDTNLNPFG